VTRIRSLFQLELEQNSILALQPKIPGFAGDILSRVVGPPNSSSAELDRLRQDIADSM
jgi:hypothetical protein